MNQPRDRAVFVARVLLGALLLVAGVLKAHDGAALTAQSVAGYRVLPPVFNAVLGVLLPYLEIALGAYLVAGFFTRGAAIVAAVQFVLFAGAVASLVIRHIPADCGCFGSGVRTPPSVGHVAADLGLALVAGFVAQYAPGAFAADRALAPSGSHEGRGEILTP